MITRLQSTVAIEELEFIQLTSRVNPIGKEGSNEVSMNNASNNNVDFPTQSSLL
jgi:hypothetical protein